MSATNKSNEFVVEDGMLTEYYGDSDTVVIPDYVTDIFFEVFSGSSKIKKLVIPGSISDVTALEFEGCSVLAEVRLLEGVESIGIAAFEGCPALTRIILPKTLKEIKTLALAYCSSLKEICYGGSEDEWSTVQKGDRWDLGTGDYRVLFNCDEV